MGDLKKFGIKDGFTYFLTTRRVVVLNTDDFVRVKPELDVIVKELTEEDKGVDEDYFFMIYEGEELKESIHIQ
ncbi:hypothetical protein K8O68_07740 [Salipaludibacillus sp. CUR1]|uniref:hypothetical protein n=1 Tax=Salipaludibacillus sp. CUR1 TaxID=2820003 RepID=UPI001E3A6674|nr:hypothetical protein [Salipaludibacillus sp. CUR1]MCE7792311.1 hypothetical protein [Salipaludibacillus sp. CUR1]